jgi:tetratricopeptide (TPR) repeat protein
MATPTHSQGELQKMTNRVTDPALAECLSGGHKAAQEGNFDQAIKVFSACIEKHPNSSDAHFFLAMAYFYKRDLEKASGELKRALQYDSNNLEAAAMLGRIYSFDKQKLSLARELLERVISAAPYKDDVRFDLARVYAMTGEEKKSLQEFHTIFVGEARYGVYHTEFAKILIAAGEKKGARSHLLRALALAPDFEPAKRLLEQLDKEEKGQSGTSAGASEKKSP